MYFSQTFKALNFDFQIQGLSRTFKVCANPDNKLANAIWRNIYLGKKTKEKLENFATRWLLLLDPY